MIYVSSSCIKSRKIVGSITELAKNGFVNIELSGGTEYYQGYEEDLLELKDKHNLNFLCHNYFPPPKTPLVLNLASLDNDINRKTLSHLKKAIALSKKLSSSKFGFHAGFFIDIQVSEIGKKISKVELFDKNVAISKFCQCYKSLLDEVDDLKLYIENNVFSYSNANTYLNNNIFMLTNSEEYDELQEKIPFNLLLDIAHLKVSSHTLGLNFREELSYLIKKSDYIHVSDNDALHDLNYGLNRNSDLLASLSQQELKDKDFTLEIYDGMDSIKKSYNLLQEIVQ